MSVPHANITCNKCDFASNTLVANGLYYYIDGTEKYDLRSQIGWCQECKTLVPMEDFSDAEECREEIIRSYSLIESSIHKPLRLLISGNRRGISKISLDKILESSKRLYVISARKGTERCLTCGSYNVKPFDGDCELELDRRNFVYTGVKRTGFVHPECGGELIATGSPARFSYRYEEKLYALDGTKLPEHNA